MGGEQKESRPCNREPRDPWYVRYFFSVSIGLFLGVIAGLWWGPTTSWVLECMGQRSTDVRIRSEGTGARSPNSCPVHELEDFPLQLEYGNRAFLLIHLATPLQVLSIVLVEDQEGRAHRVRGRYINCLAMMVGGESEDEAASEAAELACAYFEQRSFPGMWDMSAQNMTDYFETGYSDWLIPLIVFAADRSMPALQPFGEEIKRDHVCFYGVASNLDRLPQR